MSISRAGNFFLDLYLSLWHLVIMAKDISKVSGGKLCFRIVIPRRLVEEMGWEHVEHVVIRKCSVRSIEIRSLLYDEKSEGIDN